MRRNVKQPANRRETGDADWVGADWGGWGRAEGAGEGARAVPGEWRGRGPPPAPPAPGPASSPRPLPPFFCLGQHELQTVNPPPPPRTRASSRVPPSSPTPLAPANFPSHPASTSTPGPGWKAPTPSMPLPRPNLRPRPLLRPPARPRALTRSSGIRLLSAPARHPDASLRHRRRCCRRHRGTKPVRAPAGPAPSSAQTHAPRALYEYP